MYQDISSALGDSHVMFYHPQWSISNLNPISTLGQCLEVVNDRLSNIGRRVTQWPTGDQDQAARLLWVNWIYHNLQKEPIRKPILVHRENDSFFVDCGDTRLMALNLWNKSATVSVLVTDKIQHAHRYRGWIPVKNNRELIQIVGFSQDAVILFNTVQKDWTIDWLEIGDDSTVHHMHDTGQRVRMIENYLLDQPLDFRFDECWIKSLIEWEAYDTIAGNRLSTGI